MPVVSLAKVTTSPAVAGDFTARVPFIYGKRLVSNRVSFGKLRRRSCIGHCVRSELQSPRVLGSVTGLKLRRCFCLLSGKIGDCCVDGDLHFLWCFLNRFSVG